MPSHKSVYKESIKQFLSDKITDLVLSATKFYELRSY